MEERITSQYLHKLQSIYHKIGIRGILVHPQRLKDAENYINRELITQCAAVSRVWGLYCYMGAENKPTSTINSINLNSTSGANTPLALLKTKGFNIPKVASRDEEGNYVPKESLNELVIQKMYATNQFGTLGGDPALRALLKIRELATLKARYVNANLYPRSFDGNLFISNYNVCGTVTGRRGSRKHSFQYGGNAQNFPKHGELAKIYRRSLVARPGKIFLMVDQMQAEDWPTSALAGNQEALQDLENGVDRHRKLGCLIFDLPWDHYTEKQWKESIERYLGKKCRHANNYGMRKNTFSDALAKEGHSITPFQCGQILDKVNQVDPSVDKVFHKYIKDCLENERKLTTPTGRERIFFGLRAGDNGGNNKIYNEAFSYIPQSIVGDNTGFAVARIETGDERTRGCIIQESHDSIIQEIDDTPDAIWTFVQATKAAFDRSFRFHNGIEIKIPVEGELGYDFGSTVTLLSAKSKSKKLEDLSYTDIQAAWYSAQELREKELKADAQEAKDQLDNRVLGGDSTVN